MMASSVPQNGLPDIESRSSSNSMDDEESFVVLNNCVDEVTGQFISMQFAENVQATESSVASFSTMQTVTNSLSITTPSLPPTTTTPPPTITTPPLPTATPPPLSTATPPPLPTTTTTPSLPTTTTPVPTEKNENVNSMTMVSSNESNISGSSELSAEEIQQKMGSLVKENAALKENLIQNNAAIRNQYENFVKWHAEVEEVQKSHKIKFDETKKLISNLQTENAELKKLVNSSNDASKEVVDLKSKISALEFELDTLRQTNAKCNIDQTKIIQELEFQLSESEKNKFEESAKYKSQIDNLSSQLNHVEAEYDKVKEELADVKKKLPTEMDVANTENMKEQLKELAQEVVLKNTMLTEKMDLINNLHETISKLKIENECIPILKTQADVYQADFNQERQEREKLKSEKDKIAEDLRHLHRRNQKLLEQIEMLQRDAFVHVTEVPSTEHAQPATNRSTPTREEQTLFECPKCLFAFYNYQALENHVYRCLESND